ncbi:MAG: response regulator [Candidatus Binatia bacterium]
MVVIEDDESLRGSIRDLLRALGFDVEAFASAEEFLDGTADSDRACLILDVRLAGLSGFDLQRELLATGARPNTIFISGHYDPAGEHEAVSLGAIACLRKPFSAQALIALVRSALDRADDAVPHEDRVGTAETRRTAQPGGRHGRDRL